MQNIPLIGEKMKRKNKVLIAAMLAVLATVSLTMYSLGKDSLEIEKNRAYTAEEKQNISIFKNSKNSVVFISIRQQVVDYWRMDTFDIPKGAGSGFVWDKEGHIVTNFHVIKDADKAIVTLRDGKKYKASLVGTAPSYDLAVLKIQPLKKILKPLSLGNSRELKVGQTVYAIGNPFGLDWTMTKGMISALERSMHATNGKSIKHMIQTDASINPGNSGGPLLDSAGKIIGVNNMLVSPSGASAGIGFAIPVDTVKRVVSSIIKKGFYERPKIGIMIDGRINALYKHLKQKKGVVVVDVVRNSSAEQAGLKPIYLSSQGSIDFEDVIEKIGGKKVNDIEGLYTILDEYKSGDSIELKISRKGETRSVQLRLK